MANDDHTLKQLNELFKENYSEEIRKMFSDSYEYITVKNTSLARKLYAGRLGGFTKDKLLVERRVHAGAWSHILSGVNSVKRGNK